MPRSEHEISDFFKLEYGRSAIADQVGLSLQRHVRLYETLSSMLQTLQEGDEEERGSNLRLKRAEVS